MNLRNLLAALVLGVLAFGTVACSSTQPAGTQVDDAAITAKVKTKLAADPEINPFNIDVDTDEGVVRLSGMVEKERARSEAVRLARGTEGVRRVINDIKIGDQRLGEAIDDKAIAAKVKTKLAADPEINPFNIDVDAEQGVIVLSGRVATRTARAEAEKIARGTDGVRGVRNLLKVGDMTEGS